MPRRDDDHDDDRERGRILRFPLPPRRAGWVTPEHVDEDEPLAFLRAVVLRHTDPRVADEVVPMLDDPEQQAAVLAALASFVPAAMSAQIVAYRARARTLPADRERTAHEALALDPDNVDARLVLATLPHREEADDALPEVEEAVELARAVRPSAADALEPVFARVRAAVLARALTLRSRLHLAAGHADAARQDAEEAGLLVPSNGDPAIAAAAAHLVAGSGPGARRWLAGLEGEDVDGPALWGLVLAWWLEGDEERARDHLALARREAQNLEVRLVDAGKEPSRAGEAFSGIVLAWARRRGARTWLLEQGEPIADAFGEAFRFGEPLPRGRDGRLELDAAEAYGEALARRYLVSDEARALLAAGGSTEVVPWTLLDSLAHLDCTPDEWTEEDLDELLLRQVPAHLELPPEHASRGRDEMIAFLRFLRRAFGFEGARRLELHLDADFLGRFEAACRGEEV